jgi:CHAT domain-containing protein/tetratricopeptide (TPR) repeat protein
MHARLSTVLCVISILLLLYSGLFRGAQQTGSQEINASIESDRKAAANLAANGQRFLTQKNYAEAALEFAQAQRMYGEALKKARALGARDEEYKSVRLLGMYHLGLGDQYAEANRAPDANRNREMAAKWFNEALTLSRAQKRAIEIARVLNNLGVLYIHWEKYEQARAYFVEAIPLFEGLDEKEFKEFPKSVALSLCYGGLGQALGELKQYDKAAEASEKAADIFRIRGDKQQLTANLVNIVNDYCSTARWDKAIGPLQELLKLLEEQKAPVESYVVYIDKMMMTCLNLGRYNDAVGFGPRALEGWRKKNNAESAEGIGRTHFYMGVAYLNLVRYQDARDTLDLALKTFKRSAQDYDIAECLLTRSTVDLAIRDYEAAAKDCERAREVGEKGRMDDVSRTKIRLKSNFLRVEIERFIKPAAIIHSVEPGKDLLTDPLSAAAATIFRADELLRGESYQEALIVLQAAESKFSELNSPQQLSLVFRLQGECQYHLGQPVKACEAFSKALHNYEALRRQVTRPEGLGLLQESVAYLYQSYARALFAAKRYEDALCMVESGRAQGLARQISDNRSGSGMAGAPAGNSRQTAADFRTPKFAALRGLAKAHPDTLYLEFAVVEGDVLGEGGNTTLLFGLSATKGLHIFPLKIGRSGLETLVRKWRQLPTKQVDVFRAASSEEKRKREIALKAAEAEEPKVANAIYRALFLPLEQAGWLGDNTGINRLVVVADGPLLDMPFAALVISAKGSRLIDRFSLSTAISLDTLTWPKRRSISTGSFLVVADPIVQSGEGTAVARFFGKPRSLPEMKKVARKLALERPQQPPLIGLNATETAVKKRMQGCRELVAATHGILRQNNGLSSFMLFGSDEKNDGLLEAREIASMKLMLEFAALWACDSGLGQSAGGDGLLGLVWAFRAAGCPSVIASQWEVQDKATAEMMEAFYHELYRTDTRMRKDDALREAMKAMRRRRASPYFWAAFQVYGDTSPVSSKALN